MGLRVWVALWVKSKMADIMKAAEDLCKKDSLTEKDRYGQLLPCRKISPLEPFIKLEEYFMLERDTGKYLLYMAAIERATTDIVNSSHSLKDLSLKCLVLGPGLGRLVRFCIEAAKRCAVSVSIHVLEANPVAVEFLGKSFAKEIEDKIVHLYQPFTFHPKLTICDLPSDLQVHCGSFDLIVSELLGCFGDDEFLPELTSTLYKLFCKPESGIMIPDTWTNYLVPVSCPTTYSYLTTSKKPFSAGYTMGLPNDCIFLSNTKAIWTGDCKKSDMEYSCDLDFNTDSHTWITACSLEKEGNALVCDYELCSKIDQSQPDKLIKSCCHGNLSLLSCEGLCESQKRPQNTKTILKDSKHQDQRYKDSKEMTYTILMDSHSNVDQETREKPPVLMRQTDTYIHGFIGYFTSVLYKDIMIDTRHTSKHRNSFHWECYFVPLSKPVFVKRDCKVTLRMKRKCKEILEDGYCAGIKLWYEWQVLVENTGKHNFDYSQESEQVSNCQSEEENGKHLNNEACKLSIPQQIKPEMSNKLGSKYSISKKEYQTYKEKNIYKFSMQNRNGDCDAVFLTWDKP